MALDEIRRAVTIGGGAGGQAAYTLGANAGFLVEALSFDCDLSGSGSADDVWVRFLTPTGLLIVGEMVGSAQASGSVVSYSLAPYLNPCDVGASTALSITPDVFGGVTLVEGCQVLIEARSPSTGAIDAAALIDNAAMWVEPVAAPPPSEPIPLLTALDFATQAVA